MRKGRDLLPFPVFPRMRKVGLGNHIGSYLSGLGYPDELAIMLTMALSGT